MVLPDDFLSPQEARDFANEWLESHQQEQVFCDFEKATGRTWGFMRLMREGDYDFVVVRTYYNVEPTSAGHMVYKPDLEHGLQHAFTKEQRDRFMEREVSS